MDTEGLFEEQPTGDRSDCQHSAAPNSPPPPPYTEIDVSPGPPLDADPARATPACPPASGRVACGPEAVPAASHSPPPTEAAPRAWARACVAKFFHDGDPGPPPTPPHDSAPEGAQRALDAPAPADAPLTPTRPASPSQREGRRFESQESGSVSGHLPSSPTSPSQCDGGRFESQQSRVVPGHLPSSPPPNSSEGDGPCPPGLGAGHALVVATGAPSPRSPPRCSAPDDAPRALRAPAHATRPVPLPQPLGAVTRGRCSHCGAPHHANRDCPFLDLGGRLRICPCARAFGWCRDAGPGGCRFLGLPLTSCPYHLRGFCRDGAACRRVHLTPPACPHVWQFGTCRAGPKCPLAGRPVDLCISPVPCRDPGTCPRRHLPEGGLAPEDAEQVSPRKRQRRDTERDVWSGLRGPAWGSRADGPADALAGAAPHRTSGDRLPQLMQLMQKMALMRSKLSEAYQQLQQKRGAGPEPGPGPGRGAGGGGAVAEAGPPRVERRVQLGGSGGPGRAEAGPGDEGAVLRVRIQHPPPAAGERGREGRAGAMTLEDWRPRREDRDAEERLKVPAPGPGAVTGGAGVPHRVLKRKRAPGEEVRGSGRDAADCGGGQGGGGDGARDGRRDRGAAGGGDPGFTETAVRRPRLSPVHSAAVPVGQLVPLTRDERRRAITRGMEDRARETGVQMREEPFELRGQWYVWAVCPRCGVRANMTVGTMKLHGPGRCYG